MSDFEIWRASECARLGITIEQHNKLVGIARDAAAVLGVGSARTYEDLVRVIQPRTNLSQTILGLPVVESDDFPEIKEGDIILGDFSCWIKDEE